MFGNDIANIIVRIVGENGKTMGTGFFVSARGEVLTCDHVVATDTIWVETADRKAEAISGERIVRFEQLDVALLSTSLTPPGVAPLAMVPSLKGVDFLTKGFQYGSIGVTGAFPLSGTISDTTSIVYKHGTQTYSQREVVVLQQKGIDHGLSGAPLFEKTSGVVIGVVIAKLPVGVPEAGGFAVPIRALSAHAKLADLLRRNSEEVPAFGRFGNILGLQEIAEYQTRTALDTLAATRLYLRERSIAREDLRSATDQFLRSEEKVFPVVGHSGTGKTFALASLASEVAVKPTLLLRGALMLASESDLRSAAVRALDDAGETLNRPEILPERWSLSLKEQRKHLSVLLDGLNEVPRSVRQDIEGWLLKSFEWLKDAPVKWIVSCRPEFWDRVSSLFTSAPVSVFYPTRGTGHLAEPFRMADFNDTEASTALATYSLENAAVTPDEVRHPFLMRMYWEVARDLGTTLGEHFSRYLVFERFLDSKVHNVALRASSSVAVVRHLLAKAAKSCLDAKSYELSFDSYRDLFKDTVVGDQLVEEHIFLTTESGYRFSFDEVAEFLQAQSLDPAGLCESAALERMINEQDTIALNAVSFALLRLEHKGELTALRKCMSCLMSSYQQQVWTVLPAIIRCLAWLERPTEIFELIESFSAKLDDYDLEWMLKSIRLPMPEMFSLMRTLASHEHYFDWESHHWYMPLNEKDGLGSLFTQLVRRHPRSVFEQLQQWLGDTTRIVGGFATLAEVAAGLMFRYRAYDFEFVCELLATRTDVVSGEFFFRIAKHYPEELLPVVDRWIGRPDRHEAAARCLDLLHRNGRLPDSSIVGRVRRLYASVQEGRVRSQVLEMLSRFPEAAAETFEQVLQAIDAGDPVLNSPFNLIRFLRSRFDDTVQLIEAKFLRNMHDREETIHALSNFSGEISQRNRIISLIRRIWEQDQGVSGAVALFIETRCYQEEKDTPIFAHLMRLAVDLCQSADERARRFLIYAATAKGQAYGEQQMQLVDALLQVETNKDNFLLLASELAHITSAVPSAWERVDRVGRVLGEEGARSLLWKENCADLLARWVTNQIIKPTVRQFIVFAEALRAGNTPSASMEAAQAFMRREMETKRAKGQ